MISAMLLGTCSQLATFEKEDRLSNQGAVARNGFNHGTNGTENFAILSGGGDCTIHCIDGTSGDLFEATATSPSVSWGG
ncbi:hypothetical protein SAMN04489723_1134 [Algoriphagus aquimarinus]|uniref:Uncharacterized protein n=2 Tax=Algoriphagus aquimarinus TaxID=237018 RepID=A0A1I1BGA2_9BACT|nr:hypothetical protein SAMN04489723_1134 [Algoriphagus aquimarinus]